MRILYISSRFPPYIGGGERQAYLLARTLKRKGIEVDILTRPYSGRPREEIMDGLRVYHRGSFTMNKFGSIISALTWLFFVIRRGGNYTILHAHQPHSAFWIAIIGKLIWKTHTVVKLRGVNDINHFKNSRIKQVQSKRYIDKLITLNQDQYNQILGIDFPPTKVALIPNGVDTTARSTPQRRILKSDIPNPPLALLFIGRLLYKKGVDVIIEACWLLKKHHSYCIPLLIIGDGPERNTLEKMARDYGLDVIEFMGELDHSKIDDILQRNFIFISSSRHGQEGLSNALLEAMHAGLAVIAANVEGTRDIICDGMNGLLVNPEDSESLANAILRVGHDPHFRKLLGKGARNTVEDSYSISTIAKQYKTLYSGLLANES